jgi:predicted transcriptional regulator
MPKEAVFTMKLESSLREDFIAAAKASDRPASQVIRELMREYIQRQSESRAYDIYLAQKVEKGRQSIRAGEGEYNEEVERLFAERRARVAGKA